MQSLQDRAKAAGVSLVRVTYCDNANLIRAKAIPLSGLAGAEQYGIGFSVAQQALPMMYDTVLAASGLTPAGETWLVPDPATFTPLPYSPASASVLGDFHTADNQPWEHCPRSCLKRAVARAAAEGLDIQAVFEPEFYLLRPADTGGFEPVDQTNFAMSSALDQSNTVLLDLVETLNTMGLEVQIIHPESGPGQFEVSIHDAQPVDAADRHVRLREAVRGVAFRHGLAVSFAAKPFLERVGSGCHLHLSVWRRGQNVLYDHNDSMRWARRWPAPTWPSAGVSGRPSRISPPRSRPHNTCSSTNSTQDLRCAINHLFEGKRQWESSLPGQASLRLLQAARA